MQTHPHNSRYQDIKVNHDLLQASSNYKDLHPITLRRISLRLDLTSDKPLLARASGASCRDWMKIITWGPTHQVVPRRISESKGTKRSWRTRERHYHQEADSDTTWRPTQTRHRHRIGLSCTLHINPLRGVRASNLNPSITIAIMHIHRK